MPLPLPIEFFDPDSEPLDPGNVVHITDHTAGGLSRLIPEYQDTPRWQAWIASMLASVQEIETAMFDVWEAVLSIDLAAGAQLDLIGRIVLEDRDDKTDDLYRRALSVRVLINRANGRVEELIAIIRLFEDMDSEAGAYVRVRENTTVQGAHVEIRVVATPVNTQGEILKRIRQAKAAGVGLQLLVTPSPNATPLTRSFRLSRASAYPEKNTTEGLDRAPPNGGVGGYALHVVS
jgi:hypothetical protein